MSSTTTHRATLAVLVALCLPMTAYGAPTPKPDLEPPKGAPEYEAPPRPTDGADMALTVEKLQKGFDPPRPLLIWAIGSSFTNFLGGGDQLIEAIRQRWPDAPEIVYKKMVGNSTSYHFTRGWARHLVIPDQPDVVLIYNFGRTEELEKVIVDLRSSTTADIVVPTLHWCVPHKGVWPDPEARNSHQDPVALREMCRKHGVEFVESRRELTEYMIANHLEVEDLLVDSVHQSRYAAKMINRNIARHFHRAEQPGYDPRSRQRRVEAEGSSQTEASPGDWTPSEDGTAITAAKQGSTISVRFTGNRIDLIGWRAPQGGSVEVSIDGRPADQTPVFYAGYVQPDRANAPAPPNPPRDRSPHSVTLGAGIVPQAWTITMTGDEGGYQLVGSVTGPDGEASALEPFTSKSGQIVIDPELWRGAKTNRRGDRFTFEVFRSVVGEVDFAGDERAKFRVRLVENLPNGPHSLKVVACGDGPVIVDAFEVFEPPMK
ncbi:MAG TPA: SGNH/GDSL hydrolase family protein [Thermoguttaceae bacterium]|nr:SGNH/GDSL hydrolase family protein [Thermoguttaceae bacterium]